MSDDARRKARTQGRFSSDNKPARRSIGASPNLTQPTQISPNVSLLNSVNAEIISFANKLQDAKPECSPVPQITLDAESIRTKLTYENTGLHAVKPPPPCKVLKGEHFRKWINLDPTAEKESLIYYDPTFLNSEEASFYFHTLANSKHFQWEQKTMQKDGCTIPIPRLTYWYGPLDYNYGKGIAHKANNEWAPDIEAIKAKIVEYLSKKAQCEATFNSVLLNYYRDCKDGVAWHSDDEISMGVQPTIASISLGETRKFELKRNDASEPEWRVYMTNGSLLVMSGNTQADWKHRVPTEYHDRGPRINLTYRNIQPF